MPRDEDAYLLDMLLAARDGVSFAEGLALEQFKESRLQQYAVLKAIEVIGEAAAHISAETKKTHADLPWIDIISMRNRLVHGYFEVNIERVWETVQVDLPRLISQIEPMVPLETDEREA